MPNLYAPPQASLSQVRDHGSTCAPFWRRFLAAVVDVLIVTLISMLLLPYAYGVKWTWIAFEMWSGTALLFLNLIPAMFDGQTPGKRLLRIRIVSDTYAAIGWAKSLKRALPPSLLFIAHGGATVVILMTLPDTLFSSLMPHELRARVDGMWPVWLDGVLGIVGILFIGLELGAFMVTEHRQRLSDLFGGTVVVNVTREQQ